MTYYSSSGEFAHIALTGYITFQTEFKGSGYWIFVFMLQCWDHTSGDTPRTSKCGSWTNCGHHLYILSTGIPLHSAVSIKFHADLFYYIVCKLLILKQNNLPPGCIFQIFAFSHRFFCKFVKSVIVFLLFRDREKKLASLQPGRVESLCLKWTKVPLWTAKNRLYNSRWKYLAKT